MNNTSPAQPGQGGGRALVFGIGNCGRRDDGLGWAFLDRIQEEPGFEAQVEYRYQLQVEDAALVRDAARIIFVDSFAGDLPGGFAWTPCEASGDFEYTSHILPPQAVMYLCQDLYGKAPPADLLMIRGLSWELETGMSQEAEDHLDRALDFFRHNILTAAA